MIRQITESQKLLEDFSIEELVTKDFLLEELETRQAPDSLLACILGLIGTGGVCAGLFYSGNILGGIICAGISAAAFTVCVNQG
jgi:hypothetical protein